ncbi:MAG TPA: hypothetical protein VFW14_15045 [Gaiellales bacterium]|nr:hypothetical protein [Gaiellales bacterium]
MVLAVHDPEPIHTMGIRRETHGDIDHEIVGDLRTVDRLADALVPGGVLIVRVPDGKSAWGFAAQRSPHRLHVLYKRHVDRKPNAGKPGYAPFPTVHDDVVSLSGMCRFAGARGLAIERDHGGGRPSTYRELRRARAGRAPPPRSRP